MLLALCSTAAAGGASGERATGVEEQPCAAYDPQHHDWAGLCHYQADNSSVHRGGPVRVVFFGDSITEDWKGTHPGFFTDGNVDRGVSGQTTAQMLVRFRQDRAGRGQPYPGDSRLGSSGGRFPLSSRCLGPSAADRGVESLAAPLRAPTHALMEPLARRAIQQATAAEPGKPRAAPRKRAHSKDGTGKD